VWATGAALYAAYYWRHVDVVSAMPAASVVESGWLQFGGLSFLLTAAHWMGWWFWWPLPLSVVAVVLLCAGISDNECPTEVRVATAVYLLFFFVVGKPFNHYWGILTAPLWGVAAAHGLSLLRDYGRALAFYVTTGPAALAPEEMT
jgi:hypothetical protein